MIIVKLMGGLGNQMFQYATGRALAIKWNVPLKLDVSFLNDKSPKENFTNRDYELAVFNISSEIATEKQIKQSKGIMYIDFSFIEKIYRKFFTILDYHSYLYKEKKMDYDMSFSKKLYPLYLDGHWQSEKYFELIRSHLLKEFTLKNEVNEQNQKMKNKILDCTAVSIHVRRGDYTKSHNQAAFGLCDMDYYNRAMHIIEEEDRNNLSYFVFSDDMEWAEKNIKTKYPIHFINYNKGKESYLDIYLMSLCQHNIIANSSFSWWGAWLNQNPSKIVIAPQNWFNPDSVWVIEQNINPKDIVPTDWLRVEN